MSTATNDSDKLVGRQYLDLSELKKNVEEANKLMSSLGKNANLDMNSVFKKQIKDSLDALINEVKKLSPETERHTRKAGESMSTLASKIAVVTNETERLTRGGKNMAEVTRGFTQAGNVVTEIVKNGKLMSQTVVKTDSIKSANALYEKQKALLKEFYDIQARHNATGKYGAGEEDRIKVLRQQIQQNKTVISQYDQLVIKASKLSRLQGEESAMASKAQQAGMQRLVDLYKQSYDIQVKMMKLDPDSNEWSTLNTQLSSLNAEIDQMKTLYSGYVEVQNAMASGQNKVSLAGASATDARTTTEIQNLISLTRELYNERVRLTQIGSDTAEYEYRVNRISEIEEEIDLIKSKNAAYSQNAKVLKEVAVGEEKLRAAMAKQNDKNRGSSQEVQALNALKTSYQMLSTAVTEYNKAKDSGNEEGTAYWSTQISSMQEIINKIRAQASALDLTTDQQKEFNDLVQKCLNLQAQHTQALKGANTPMGKLLSQAASLVMSYISIQAVQNQIKNVQSAVVKYSTEYYDAMNEIRIVTMQSEESIDRMGATYRALAQDMSVSSKDIASAAVEFWRQGLGESDVNDRIRSTTQYAKISSLEFKEAAEIVTAATNGMGVSAQRAVDVFSYQGDASASGADEVGRAMQVVAGSAQEAGLTMEWLGAYIATISEKTRQAPEVIGRSLNSIISRLQSIKQKGFNEEDETQINDVAKALSTINVALMDQDGNWRNMSDIFMDIAKQWAFLDDKTRAYIATTMAGTQQKNRFMVLMDDMSKVSSATGEASRAIELYEGAMTSAGNASRKYAIYEESVAAAHDRMSASLENLYSLFDVGLVKDFYDNVSDLANLVYFLAGGKVEQTGTGYENVISSMQGQVDVVRPLIQEYTELSRTQNRTEEQNRRMSEIINILTSKYQPFNEALSDSNGNFLSGEAAIKAMNGELGKTIDLLVKFQRLDIQKQISDLSGLELANSNFDNSKANQQLMGVIQEAANIFGYGNLEDLTVEQFNGLGHQINFYKDWALIMPEQHKQIYSLFRPNGKLDADLWNAWEDFYDQYGKNVLDGYWTMVNETTADAEGGLEQAIREKLNLHLASYMLDLDPTLQTAMMSLSSNAMDSVVTSITEADWAKGASYVNQKIATEFADKIKFPSDIIFSLRDQIDEYISETDPTEKMIKGMNLNNHIAWLNNTYNLSIPFIDEIVELKNSSDAAGESMQHLQSEINAVVETLQNSIADQALQSLKDSGFSSWISEMKEFVKNEDGVGLYNWILGKDEGQLEAFVEAYPMFSEFMLAVVEGKGIIDESTNSWAAFGVAVDEATDKFRAYREEVLAAQEAEVTDAEGYGIAKNLKNTYDTKGLEEYRREVARLSDEERKWLEDNVEGFEDSIVAMDGTADEAKKVSKAMDKVGESIGKLELKDLEELGKVWEDTTDIMEDAEKGGKDYADAYSDVIGKVEDLSQAQGALAAIQNGTLTSVEDLDNAYSVLASYTGLSADSLRNDLSPAVWMLNNDMAMAGSTVEYMANWLANAAGVQFTAANWQSQLAVLAAQADTTTGRVANLVNAMLQAAGSSLYMDGNTVKVKWGGGSFKPKSTGGGGSRGGGGSGSSKSSSNEMSEIEKMLDLMKQIQDIRDHQRDMFSEARSYYETTGELQGVIKYYEKERDAILDNNKVLEDNIKKIEALLPAKQKEVASMSTSDKAYEQAAKDLEGLQEAHQEYTKQLLANRTEVEEFNQAIKEQNDTIREMEIELRETIQEAIKDREELNERMLEGTIDVENEILEIIKARYEKERDEILETSEAKREALEQEKELLDEQLEARKKAAEQEDKQLKLTQLQAKLERISADPTRKKEELELRKEIAELRDEMAWDLAEDEVEAQKESIDQQIDSLDEYIEYVENYYEELFKHPTKLIEEMKLIISKTDDEIIAWLKQNSEEYAASTEATQQDMINSWNEMLMDMHGSVEDYWDEVESIIAGGDEAIIAFLKEHSADYKEAGKLQAEAYVDEWKKQLEDLRKAHKEITEEINNTTYTVVKPSTGTSSSSGGGTGGSSNSNVDTGKKPTTVYYLTINGKIVGNPVFTESEAARMVYLTRQSGNYQDTDKISYTSMIRAYKEGGLADFTGPAWLDGTKMKPERILSSYQTELFEDLIASLHQIKVSTKSMPMINYDSASAGHTFSFGDIVINAESLKTDEDYRAVAEQLMEYIMDAMSRGSAVGGIRVTR